MSNNVLIARGHIFVKDIKRVNLPDKEQELATDPLG